MTRRRRPRSAYEPKTHHLRNTLLMILLCVAMFGCGWFAVRPVLGLFGFL